MGDILEMGDSPPPGYSGGSVLQTPATEIPMMRVQGGGGGGSDVFGQVPQIPIQRMVGGNGSKDDDIVTEAVITHIIATILATAPEPAPAVAPAPALAAAVAPALAAAAPVMIENMKPIVLAPITPRLYPNVEPVPDSFNPPTPVEEEPLPLEPLPLEFEPVRNLKGIGKDTKLLWNYSGKNRIRVRTNLTDAEIKAFLTLKPEAFQLDERALFDSLFFSDDDVRKYLVDHSDGFVRFWRRFIDYDGTDPVILYTTKEGRFYQDFLKNIANVRLKNLLGNVAYLLPAHKRTAYVDAGNLVLGKQEQKTVKPSIDFLPTEVEKTQFTQEQFDNLVKPIEKKLAVLDDKDVTDKITIDNFNKAKEFVKVYEEVQKDMLVLKGMKSDLEAFQKGNEPKIEGIKIVIQKLTGASTQDRNYIAELTRQNEALDQINTEYKLYISNIDGLVSKGEENLEFRKKVYDTLTGKLKKMFKEPKAPSAAAPAAVADEAPAAAPAPAPARAAVSAATVRVQAAKAKKEELVKQKVKEELAQLKLKVESCINPQEIIDKVLEPFFKDKKWTKVSESYGESRFFSSILWAIQKNKIPSTTAFEQVKEDKEENLWDYLFKLLFLKEYTEVQINKIKEILQKFIDVPDDYSKMLKLYEHMYPSQTGGNLPRVPKRVTLRKSKVQKQA